MKNLSRKELIEQVSDLYTLTVKLNKKTGKWQVKDGKKIIAEFDSQDDADYYLWDARDVSRRIESQRSLRGWLGLR